MSATAHPPPRGWGGTGTRARHTNALNAQATVNFGRAARGGNFFAGTLDEVSFYNTVLSAARMAAHYAAR